MKFDKKTKSVIAVHAICLFIYVVAFLIIPFKKIAASWISFVFTIVAVTGSLFIFKLAFSAKESIISKVYGYPVFRIGLVYALTQFVLGIVICTIGAFVAVPYWISLIISVILLGAAGIGVIVTENTRDFVEKVDQATKISTFFIDSLVIDAENLMARAMSDIAIEKCKMVYEAIRYSDPVSNNGLVSVENEITTVFRAFSEAIVNNDVEAIRNAGDELVILICKRNKMCKLFKREN